MKVSKRQMVAGLSDEFLVEQYARLAQRLSRLPLQGELIRESKVNPAFPSEKTFRRFRGKANLLKAVAAFCSAKRGFEEYWHRRFAEKRLKNEWFALTGRRSCIQALASDHRAWCRTSACSRRRPA